MIESISALKKEKLRAFQQVCLLEVPNIPIEDMNKLLEGEYEYIQYYSYKGKDYAYDLYYKIYSYSINVGMIHINQNWAFIKERLKQLGYVYPHEIVYDTIINISMSSNIIVKESFDFYNNLLSTIKYYSNSLKSNILLRTDDFNGNKFFLYKR